MSSSRLRVAIAAPSLRILGGQAVQADRLLRAWNSDPDVHAWLVPHNPLPPGPLRFAVSVKYARTVVTELTYVPLLVRELAKADIVHVFSASYFSFLLAPLPAVVVARALRKPVIVHYHSGEAPDHLARSGVARAALSRTDGNVVPSAFLAGVFSSFGLRAEVVPNLVDLDRFAFRERSPLRPHVLSTRNFEPIYNVACTLRAFKRFQERIPDASLTLVGGGSEDGSLRRLARELRLRNVLFAGRVDPNEIARYYADHDVYVQSPNIDNMPVSVLEAYASGLPVVSTGVGGIPTMLVDGRHGLLAARNDDRQLAAQMLRLFEEPGLAAGLTSRAFATCDAYSWPSIRARWLEIYRRTAAARATGDGRTQGREPSSARHTLARIRHMDRRELSWRTVTTTRTLAGRIATSAMEPRWSRSRLRRAIARTDATRDLRHALARNDWPAAHGAIIESLSSPDNPFPIAPPLRGPVSERIRRAFPSHAEEASAKARRILDGSYDLLGYTGLRFGAGSAVDWQYDPVHDRRPPRLFWSRVPYLSPACGDHKVIWELNRHQHWLALGRAFWLTGRREYRDCAIAQLASWLEQNPPLIGINWASMLELAFRSLSWLWALNFFGAARGAMPHKWDNACWSVDLVLGLDRQLQHVEEHLSYYFSPNTHLLGEGLALYVAGRSLPMLARSARRADVGRRVLLDEMSRQICRDGGHCERSMHYHRYTLDFYLLALIVARLSGDAAADRFHEAVAALADAARLLADDGGRLPHFGDDDGGAAFPIAGRALDDCSDSLEVASVLLERPGLRTGAPTEEAMWLLAHPRWARATENVRLEASAQPPSSRVLDATGYCVSRSAGRTHLVFDAGPHGYRNGGHAHADALSLTLSVGGVPVLIDPGTQCYTIDPAARDRMRSTALHNTLMLDGQPASVPGGPFQWRRTASARLCRWRSCRRFDFIDAAHDAYAPLVHRRRVVSLHDDLLIVADVVLGSGTHQADVHWHLDPRWTVQAGARLATFLHDGASLQMALAGGELERFAGDSRERLGWHSPVYGRLEPATTLRVRRKAPAPFWIAAAFGLEAQNAVENVETVPVWSSAGTLDHSLALRITRANTIDTIVFTESQTASAPAMWRVAEIEANAAMLFCRTPRRGSEGVLELALVDGSVARGHGRFSFDVERPMDAGAAYFDRDALTALDGGRDHVRDCRIC